MKSVTVTVATPVIYASGSTVSAGATSLPMPLTVVAIPGAGTLVVEYQVVSGGSWTAWPAGIVAAKTVSVMNGAVFALRFTAAGADGVVELNHE